MLERLKDSAGSNRLQPTTLARNAQTGSEKDRAGLHEKEAIMSLVYCPECGEETLDRLTNCPLCNEPLVESLNKHKTKTKRLYFLGLAFVGGLALATLCNIAGYTTLAITFAVVGILCMAGLLLKLNATN